MKRRVLWATALIAILSGGAIAVELLLFRSLIPTFAYARVLYLIEDSIFFLAVGTIATLTFRVWWPYIWHSSIEQEGQS